MLKKIAIASVIFASACIDDGVGGDPGPIPADKEPLPSEQELEQTPRERTPDMAIVPACNEFPQDDSACAHACDQDALLSYIPEGTCMTFSCPMKDGSTYVTGGCNN